jgi:hypothetical protein
MYVYFLDDFVTVLSMSFVYLEEFIHSSTADAVNSEQTTMSLKTHLKTPKEQEKINLLHQPQQGANIYGSNMDLLLPSKHNYPYDSKVLKSVMFTLRRHVSADTGSSSGQHRT